MLNSGCKRTVPGSQKLSRFKPTGLAHLDYHVCGVMLEKHHELQPNRKTSDELKAAMHTIWKELAQEHINKAVTKFFKRLTVYMALAASSGHCEHL